MITGGSVALLTSIKYWHVVSSPIAGHWVNGGVVGPAGGPWGSRRRGALGASARSPEERRGHDAGAGPASAGAAVPLRPTCLSR